MRILINATNLHVGGGVQVATSFLSELPFLIRSDKSKLNISVFCSDKVYNNLPENFDKSAFDNFEIINIYGIRPKSKEIINKFSGFDVCFTIFGPLYFKPNVKVNICGFAQPWIAYPDNVAYSKLPIKERLKNKIKYEIQSLFFHRNDHLVVEQKHVKDALCKLGFKSNDVSVVSNCVSSIYENKDDWRALSLEGVHLVEDITLGFIGRAYPHKNVSILKQVNDILIDKYHMKCNFLFTFAEEEMELCGFSDYGNFHSVGEINATQCPAFYNQLDALVFPSLLECFSASPIEAMKMNTTVIASDYPFVREVCGDASFYFDPMSADDIATTIFNALSDNELRESKKLLGTQLVNGLPTAKDRAISYLNIIRDSF